MPALSPICTVQILYKFFSFAGNLTILLLQSWASPRSCSPLLSVESRGGLTSKWDLQTPSSESLRHSRLTRTQRRSTSESELTVTTRASHSFFHRSRKPSVRWLLPISIRSTLESLVSNNLISLDAGFIVCLQDCLSSPSWPQSSLSERTQRLLTTSAFSPPRASLEPVLSESDPSSWPSTPRPRSSTSQLRHGETTFQSSSSPESTLSNIATTTSRPADSMRLELWRILLRFQKDPLSFSTLALTTRLESIHPVSNGRRFPILSRSATSLFSSTWLIKDSPLETLTTMLSPFATSSNKDTTLSLRSHSPKTWDSMVQTQNSIRNIAFYSRRACWRFLRRHIGCRRGCPCCLAGQDPYPSALLEPAGPWSSHCFPHPCRPSSQQAMAWRRETDGWPHHHHENDAQRPARQGRIDPQLGAHHQSDRNVLLHRNQSTASWEADQGALGLPDQGRTYLGRWNLFQQRRIPCPRSSPSHQVNWWRFHITYSICHNRIIASFCIFIIPGSSWQLALFCSLLVLRNNTPQLK